jgi:coproporphyrinogen III oxidase-like Fe-S oxidoreductase
VKPGKSALQVLEEEKSMTESLTISIFDMHFALELARLCELERDGLEKLERDRIEIATLGRIFIRNVAMIFDAYLNQEAMQQKVFSRTL